MIRDGERDLELSDSLSGEFSVAFSGTKGLP